MAPPFDQDRSFRDLAGGGGRDVIGNSLVPEPLIGPWLQEAPFREPIDLHDEIESPAADKTRGGASGKALAAIIEGAMASRETPVTA